MTIAQEICLVMRLHSVPMSAREIADAMDRPLQNINVHLRELKAVRPKLLHVADWRVQEKRQPIALYALGDGEDEVSPTLRPEGSCKPRPIRTRFAGNKNIFKGLQHSEAYLKKYRIAFTKLDKSPIHLRNKKVTTTLTEPPKGAVPEELL